MLIQIMAKQSNYQKNVSSAGLTDLNWQPQHLLRFYVSHC